MVRRLMSAIEGMEAGIPFMAIEGSAGTPRHPRFAAL
jgi:hypothetical protein